MNFVFKIWNCVLKTKKFCTKNKEFCIKNDAFCSGAAIGAIEDLCDADPPPPPPPPPAVCEDVTPFDTSAVLPCASLLAMGLTTCDTDAGSLGNANYGGILVSQMCQVTCNTCGTAQIALPPPPPVLH